MAKWYQFWLWKRKKVQPEMIVITDAFRLSGSWDESRPIEVGAFDTVGLCVTFVKGDSDGCEFSYSFSRDGHRWYRSVVGRRLGDSASTRIDIPVIGAFMRMRYKALGRTESANATLTIKAVLEKLKGK